MPPTIKPNLKQANGLDCIYCGQELDKDTRIRINIRCKDYPFGQFYACPFCAWNHHG